MDTLYSFKYYMHQGPAVIGMYQSVGKAVTLLVDTSGTNCLAAN